jgi:uncharacterized protein YjbI with pentapeptide repeats
MARRTPKLRPDAPLGPDTFDPAPAELVSGALWDCVEAGADTVVPEHVADLKIQESRWTDGDLAGRSFGGLRIRDTHFVHCDLSGAVLDSAVLERVAFTGCRLTGTVFSGARLTDVLISESRADLLNLRMARATALLVEDTSLRGADLYELETKDCALLRCDLTEISLHDARLAGTRLHGSTIADVRGALALRGTHIGVDQQIAVGIELLAALGVKVDQN